MKRIFTLLVSAFLFTMVMGQPTALIKKATVSPIVDGIVDEVWAEADANDINVPFAVAGIVENPTIGNSWWKMLWDDQGIYLLCFVDDDVFVPAYKGEVPANSYNYDKPEIYFDCNYEKQDALGGGDGEGHYQFAPTENEALVNGGTATIEDNGSSWAFNATDEPTYYVEYFFPFTALLDKDEIQVDKTEPIGFDVNIMDNDILSEKRDRMNWANAGVNGESWTTMDDAGLITLDGGQPPVYIQALTIAGESEITTDNGTTQFSASIEPTEATQTYRWSITNITGMATISNTGIVTATRNGTVMVKALSADGFVQSDEFTVTISNQKVTIDEISIIKNGDFNVGVDNMDGWGFTKEEVFSVAEDWLTVMLTPQTNRWDININQGIPISTDNTVKYIIRFKAKASVDMILPLVNEDSFNETYNKDGVSNSPYGATSDWAIPVTTEPQWFELDVVFANQVEGSTYSFGFQPGALDGTLYLDSISMFKESDLAFVTSSKTIASQQLSVYPNPVVNELTVSMTSNGKVAIYNALGQKMMEKLSTGNFAKFNVSSLRHGMYFVRLGDGTTQKFIK